MICFHRGYDLGDKHNYNADDYNSWGEIEKAIIKEENPAVILPLYMYDHSGISISTSPFGCRWDSGQIGFVLVSKKQALEEFGGGTSFEQEKSEDRKYYRSRSTDLHTIR
jgi:hypothetical protein